MSMELNKESVEQAGGDERAAFKTAYLAEFDCDADGDDNMAHSNTAWRAWKMARAALAQPSPKCATCNGTGLIDDGEITCSEGGIPYENGPVKCVKDCPACKAQPSPAQAEQAEAERPEVVGYRSKESGMVYEQDYGLKNPEALTTVAECDRIVGELWAEIAMLRSYEAEWELLLNDHEQQRDAALARVAELEHVLRVVVNAADHGSWPTTVMHGIEKVREVLAGSAPPAKAQHSDQSELRRIAVALTNPLLNGQEASDLMVRYEALTMPDHIIALIDSQAQYIAPDELRAICMLVAEAGIKYGRGRDRAVASDECREVVDSVLPLEPSPSNSEQHCEPEIMAVAEGVLTFMRSEKEGSHCTCCNGPHIFCRYFEGMSDFDDITRKARFRNDLEGRTFRLVLELLPAALSGKEGV